MSILGPGPFQTMTCLQKRRDHTGVPQITAAEKCQPQSVAHGEGFAKEIADSLGMHSSLKRMEENQENQERQQGKKIKKERRKGSTEEHHILEQ